MTTGSAQSFLTPCPPKVGWVNDFFWMQVWVFLEDGAGILVAMNFPRSFFWVSNFEPFPILAIMESIEENNFADFLTIDEQP